jgi:phosphoribulokinase
LRAYGKTGRCQTRTYVHDDEEAEAPYGVRAGHASRPGERSRRRTDLLFYEGLHGAVSTDKRRSRRQCRPQDRRRAGHQSRMDPEDPSRSRLARLHDGSGDRHDPAAHAGLRPYICPQFTQTDINFQRVPIVDTSNPFIARWIPTADESMVVIRFRSPRGIDFPYLLSMIAGSFMTRANSIVIPGDKLDSPCSSS